MPLSYDTAVAWQPGSGSRTLQLYFNLGENSKLDLEKLLRTQGLVFVDWSNYPCGR